MNFLSSSWVICLGGGGVSSGHLWVYWWPTLNIATIARLVCVSVHTLPHTHTVVKTKSLNLPALSSATI